VTDEKLVKEACNDVDAIIHLAALLPPFSEAVRELTMRVNVGGTRNITNTLITRQHIPLIFASSISTYGITVNEVHPIRDDHPQSAHDLYSESKIEAEKIVRGSGIPHTILRIAPIAVANLVELPDIIPSRADQRVEFICLDDAARAIYAVLGRSEALDHSYNIAGGPSWQMRGVEYIDSFYSALGVDVDSVFSDEYTAIDWYDTSRSAILDYQRVTFDKFLEKLKRVAIVLGLI